MDLGNERRSTAPADQLIRSGHRVHSLHPTSISFIDPSPLPRLVHSFYPELVMALSYMLGLSTTALLVVGLCTWI